MPKIAATKGYQPESDAERQAKGKSDFKLYNELSSVADAFFMELGVIEGTHNIKKKKGKINDD